MAMLDRTGGGRQLVVVVGGEGEEKLSMAQELTAKYFPPPQRPLSDSRLAQWFRNLIGKR